MTGKAVQWNSWLQGAIGATAFGVVVLIAFFPVRANDPVRCPPANGGLGLIYDPATQYCCGAAPTNQDVECGCKIVPTP